MHFLVQPGTYAPLKPMAALVYIRFVSSYGGGTCALKCPTTDPHPYLLR
jgi:hypothetical protein